MSATLHYTICNTAAQLSAESQSITTAVLAEKSIDFDVPKPAATALVIEVVIMFPSVLQKVWRPICLCWDDAIFATYELFCLKFRDITLFSHQVYHRFQLFSRAFRKTFGHVP